MTNQTRDFDQDDAEVLAELIGIDYVVNASGVVMVYPPDRDRGIRDPFRPWSEESEQWQIQSVKDAVREKGLVVEFGRNLYYKINSPEVIEMAYSYREGDSGTAEINFKGITNVASAPPEAICSAVLEIISEGSGE